MERSSSTGSKKKPTFTPVEIRTMLEFIQQTKLVLIESGTPAPQAAIKLRSCVDWTGLAALLTGMGVAERTDVEVRKKFENLLFETKKKFRFRLAGVQTQSEWTEVHEMALQLVGRENMLGQISSDSDCNVDVELKPSNGIQFVNTELSETPTIENSEMQTELINPDYAENDRSTENGSDDRFRDNDGEAGLGDLSEQDAHNHSSPPNSTAYQLDRPKIPVQSEGHASDAPFSKRSKLVNDSSGNECDNSTTNEMVLRVSPLKMTLRNRLSKSSTKNFRFAVANSGSDAAAGFSSHSRSLNTDLQNRSTNGIDANSAPSQRARNGSTPLIKRRSIGHYSSKYAAAKVAARRAENGVNSSKLANDTNVTESRRLPKPESDWLAEEHAAKMRVRSLKEQKLAMQIRILKLQEALLRKRLGNVESPLSDGDCDIDDAEVSTDHDLRLRV